MSSTRSATNGRSTELAASTARLSGPLIGCPLNGVSTLYGSAEVEGRAVDLRAEWEAIDEDSATWQQQQLSGDAGVNGSTWRTTFWRSGSEAAFVTAARATSDFDFLIGSWRLEHHRLLAPLDRGSERIAFKSTQEGFIDGVGTLYCRETFGGQAVAVRALWTGITDTTAMWRQHFSFDGGTTWEENRQMRLTWEAGRR